MTTEPTRCSECRRGEHENLTAAVRLVRVTNPETQRTWRRALCEDHIQAAEDDGYTVKEAQP